MLGQLYDEGSTFPLSAMVLVGTEHYKQVQETGNETNLFTEKTDFES